MSTTPQIPDTLAEERRAKLTLTITKPVKWFSVILIIAMIGLRIFLPHYPHFLAYACTLVPLFLTSQVYPSLYYRGRSKIGAHLLVAGMLLAILLVPLIFPEILVAVALCQGIMFLIIYMLLGSRDARWVIVIAIALLLAQFAWVEYAPFRLFAPIDRTMAFFLNLLIGMAVAIGTAVIVHLTTDEQNLLYQLQQETNQQLDAAAQQSQQSRVRLESMVKCCVAYMSEVSRGNMLAHLALDANGMQPDEPLLVLGKNLEAMTANLRGMIFKMKEAAEDLNLTASEIVAATTQQVAGASEQSSAISQTSVTVDEVRAIAHQAMQRAEELANMAQRSVEFANSGKQSVEATVRGMREIRGMVERIAENILSLSEHTQRIGDITATVNEIAAQSNILALNASVEAARAGEQGKGFAVVAAEVRTLAEQSRQATAQVRAILSDIQKATNSTVMVTEVGSKGVDQGVALVNQTGQAIEGLARAIDEAAQAAVQMAAGGKQQMAGVDQVAIAIQAINQATVQSLGSTRQTEQAAQELNHLAGSLTEMISGYRVA